MTTRKLILGCVSVCLLGMVACNDSLETPEFADEEVVSTASEALTVGNPEFDASYVTMFADGTYTDLAAASYALYAVRAGNGDIDVLQPSNGAYQSTISGSYTNADWVDGSWNLVASSNSARRIYINAQNSSPEVSFAYPSNVTIVRELAAVAISSNQLRVWIRVASGSVAGGDVLRTGTYTRGVGANWDSRTFCGTRYDDGLASNGSQLYTFIDYIIEAKRFKKVNPVVSSGSCSTVSETFSGTYNNHGYHHPNGYDDSVAPDAFDVTSTYYWSLERYRQSDSFIRQALVKIPLSQVVY